MIKVGIIGGAGYTAGELLRILFNHPEVHIQFIHSTTQAGQPIYKTHTDLLGDTKLCFTDTVEAVDVLFLCLGHGVSRSFLSNNPIAATCKVIDLGNDFRLNNQFAHDTDTDVSNKREFVYGLPEIHKSAIIKANNIANPGCFATAIQLALLPLAQGNLLTNEVHINALTGSTGAGRSLSETAHFTSRNGNISVYKAFSHQHLGEIRQQLDQVIGKTIEKQCPELHFIPVRGNFTRGIFATLYTDTNLTSQQAFELYTNYYKDQPFVHVSDQELSLKDVVNTNKCLLHVQVYGRKLLITSVIDNLIKGASGQAVQNMNLMFGLPEDMGLHLKSIAF